MLHRNMNAAVTQLALDDLLADLWHARRQGDLGRLAFVTYCEVRRWARGAGETALAEHASEMIIASPHASRERFLAEIDALISELEQLRPKFLNQPSAQPVGTAAHSIALGAQAG
jgi:hypothetical protein